jgi:hypothetical protein
MDIGREALLVEHQDFPGPSRASLPDVYNNFSRNPFFKILEEDLQ